MCTGALQDSTLGLETLRGVDVFEAQSITSIAGERRRDREQVAAGEACLHGES